MKRRISICIVLICSVLFCSCSLNGAKDTLSTPENTTVENTTIENTSDENKEYLTNVQIKDIYKKDGFIVDTIEEYKNNALVIYHEESSTDPNIKLFEYIDRVTGIRELIHGRVIPERYFIQSDKDLIIITTGKYLDTGDMDFPKVIYNIFVGDYELSPEYKRIYQTYYAKIDEQHTIGLRKNESIVDIRIGANSIEICFGPQKGNEVIFYAGHITIPETQTSYDKQSNTQIITFIDTDIDDDMKKLAITDSNYYIESAKLQKDNENTKLFIKLKSTAKFYTAEAKIITSERPFVVFSYKEEYRLPW